MSAALDEVSATLDADTLAGLAVLAARDGAGAADNQRVTEMHGNLGVGTHLYRVSGDGQGGEWSYVLKIFDLPGSGYTEGSDDPKAWNFWEREWLVYRAPWFRALTGVVTPPTCLGSGAGGDGRLWIAIEDHAQDDDRPWPLERFGTVARHFGEFNAAFLDEEARPDDEWLSRTFLQGWAERSGPLIEQFNTVADNPLVARTYPPRIIDELVRVWEGRHSLYRALNDLDQTLCHLDVHPHNVFVVREARSVAIDWSYTGISHLGADVAGLVGGSLALQEVPYNQADELEALCLRNYLEGLRSGGWTGSERDVELGYVISGVLQGGIGVVSPALMICLNDDLRPFVEQGFGQPVEKILESVTQLADHWMQRIDRIRRSVDF